MIPRIIICFPEYVWWKDLKLTQIFPEINKENLIYPLTSENIKNMAGNIPEHKGAIY
jgi:hypothetical protein